MANAAVTTMTLVASVVLAVGGCDHGGQDAAADPSMTVPSLQADSKPARRDAPRPQPSTAPEPLRTTPALSVPPREENQDAQDKSGTPDPVEVEPPPSKIEDRCGRPLVT